MGRQKEYQLNSNVDNQVQKDFKPPPSFAGGGFCYTDDNKDTGEPRFTGTTLSEVLGPMSVEMVRSR